MQKITPFLWFNANAEEAANYYVSVFSKAPNGGKNSKITGSARYDDEASKASGMPAGSVMTIAFQLDGQDFTAINGGPHFKLTEAVSFVVNCKDQEELDYFWNRLTEGGDEKSQVCGWLKDKYGLSWQILPEVLSKYMGDKDPAKSQRVMKAILGMKKIEIDKLQQAYDGVTEFA
ncbi:MAG: VOC family protein [Ignavibacteriaceae bacterium]